MSSTSTADVFGAWTWRDLLGGSRDGQVIVDAVGRSAGGARAIYILCTMLTSLPLDGEHRHVPRSRRALSEARGEVDHVVGGVGEHILHDFCWCPLRHRPPSALEFEWRSFEAMSGTL